MLEPRRPISSGSLHCSPYFVDEELEARELLVRQHGFRSGSKERLELQLLTNNAYDRAWQSKTPD
jgi:hypothetical protein